MIKKSKDEINGVSSQILFLLHAVGPLKQKQLQEILHPDSEGSGQIPKVLNRLELVEKLIKSEKIIRKHFKGFTQPPSNNKEQPWAFFQPLFDEKETPKTVYQCTYRWIEKAYGLELTTEEKKFVDSVFKARIFGMYHNSKFTFEDSYDLYGIYENGVKDELIAYSVGTLLTNDFSGAVEQFRIALKENAKRKGEGAKAFDEVMSNFIQGFDSEKKILLYSILMRESALSKASLMKLANPIIEERNEKKGVINHDIFRLLYMLLR